jgi:hypothetical protein
MTSILCYDLYQVVFVFNWLAGVLCTLPSPWWLDSGASASDRAQHFALQTPTSHQAEQGVGAGKPHVEFNLMTLVLIALHRTLQTRYLHCSRCL